MACIDRKCGATTPARTRPPHRRCRLSLGLPRPLPRVLLGVWLSYPFAFGVPVYLRCLVQTYSGRKMRNIWPKLSNWRRHKAQGRFSNDCELPGSFASCVRPESSLTTPFSTARPASLRESYRKYSIKYGCTPQSQQNNFSVVRIPRS
jgi:hypothetical protein